MSDEILAFDELDLSELSVEDLAVIQAFEAMEVWSPQLTPCQTTDQNHILTAPQTCYMPQHDEMLLIFVTEAAADLASMRQILHQLTQDKPSDLALFTTLKRVGHKLHGTAGAIGFPLISTVARQVELIAEAASHCTVSPPIAIEAISTALTVLDACLSLITSTHKEPDAPSLLATLEAVYQNLNLDLQQLPVVTQPIVGTGLAPVRMENPLPSTSPLLVNAPQPTEPLPPSTPENTHKTLSCFLVRAADQHLLIPFHQIQRISNSPHEQTDLRHPLHQLLGFPSATNPTQHLLILSFEHEILERKTASIVVDEVLGEQTCIVEPLSPCLQRPGIAGTTIDGSGRVLLVVDLLELLRFAGCK